MKVRIKHWSAVAQWHWNNRVTGNADEGDVCGICRVPYEGCCPSCKMPGEDCPLSEHGFLFPTSGSGVGSARGNTATAIQYSSGLNVLLHLSPIFVLVLRRFPRHDPMTVRVF
jgi:hypothetical protein